MANSPELQTISRGTRVPLPVRSGRSGQHLAHAGSNPAEILRLESGWAVEFRLLPDGRRHIIDYFIPGDWCDVAWLPGGAQADAVRAVTDFSVVPYSTEKARTLLAGNLALAAQFHALLSRRLRLQTDRALGLGRKTATERLAHLLCEIALRTEAACLADKGTCFMPLTQTDLADLTGLTPIHVNRVLQQLRAADMIHLTGRQLTVTSRERLQRLAMFNGDYLKAPLPFDLGVTLAGSSGSTRLANASEPARPLVL